MAGLRGHPQTLVVVRIAIAGASGYVGRNLASHLDESGHDVVAIGRSAAGLPHGARVRPVAADVVDADAMASALQGVDAAFYLVHSMAGPEFMRRDRKLARAFAEAAARAGVRRIVYLGALGGGDLSRHLASRHEVGRILASTGVDVIELRAAIVLGAGSISFEMMRYLVERLPAMICPRWVRTQIEPIAERDLLEYLIRSLSVAPGVYEIGCGEPTTYQALMNIYARERGLRPRVILNLPLLSLRLSSYWVDLVTPVNRTISHSLIESLASEVVVIDRERTHAAFGFTPMPAVRAVRAALDDQVDEVSESLPERGVGLSDGVYTVRFDRPIDRSAAERVRASLASVGGDFGWYGLAWAWRIRMALGNALGEDDRLIRPNKVVAGEIVDWWTVVRASSDELVLRSRTWKTGESWIAIAARDGRRLSLAAAFRPKGLPGFLYWKLLQAIHSYVFRALARRMVRTSHTAGRFQQSPGPGSPVSAAPEPNRRVSAI